jgi:hypothetical protein
MAKQPTSAGKVVRGSPACADEAATARRRPDPAPDPTAGLQTSSSLTVPEIIDEPIAKKLVR